VGEKPGDVENAALMSDVGVFAIEGEAPDAEAAAEAVAGGVDCWITGLAD